MTALCFEQLKRRHRLEREIYPEGLNLRVHRALSWLDKAESCEDDDSKLIFLWIAFNAAYACDIPIKYRPGEQHVFGEFISRLNAHDKQERLSQLVWQSFTGPIRVLLDNRFVFQPYWDHLNGKLSEEAWKASFARAKRAASKALSNNDTPKLLSIVLARVYTLRNQLVHGGATWNSGINRNQVRDCTHLMQALVPSIINIMMDAAQSHWGDPYYPVINDS
ncbi:HEPN domain-containing protein [Ferrimonas futtsuensis]|uniref:HEPN domain-containing protein n=1 Tax=Ferrimonas futtsuensis TaxID=364764 RepID=UPI0003F85B03|nr:HEPN domain-containing protein [Ferrimonas futtsuensis]